MKKISQKIGDLAAFNLFGLCTFIGNKIGISVDKVRIYFIYFSFIMLGSPVLLYLIMSFLLEFYKLMKRRQYRIWDL